MRRLDWIPLGLAGGLAAFVAGLALRAPHRPPAPPPADAHRDGAVDSAPPLPPARPASAAPDRDAAYLRRRIEQEGGGTYMSAILRENDSTLNRWPERTVDPLRVWVEPQSSVDGFRPEYVDVARHAFEEWNGLGLPLRFSFVLDSAGSDLKVTWVERLPEDRIGVTQSWTDASGWIVGAGIRIALHSRARGREPIPPDVVRATARHEVGHLIGLKHSDDPRDLMYPSATALDFSPRDRATAQLLYSLPPGSAKGAGARD